MITYILTPAGFSSIMKFASSDPSRDTLNSVFVQKVFYGKTDTAIREELKNKIKGVNLSGGNSKFIAPEKMTRAEKLKHIQALKKTNPKEAMIFWLRHGTRISRKTFEEL